MKDSKFEIGNNVTLTNGPWSGITGEIVKMDAGWYHVELGEEADEPGKIVKARANALTLASVETDPDEEADGAIDIEQAEDDLDEALTIAQQMAEALRKARVRYTKTRRPSGAMSADCADALARELREIEPADAMTLCDKVMQEPIGTAEAKYANLNNGQKRMNSGNRIRAALKKAQAAQDMEEVARICDICGIDLADLGYLGYEVAEQE